MFRGRMAFSQTLTSQNDAMAERSVSQALEITSRDQRRKTADSLFTPAETTQSNKQLSF